ncbi:MAG: endopeptidase [Solirubrobacteraceae bacterium]|nr:endopeptidase [Solirubrobacteraceae bacterium]
MLRGRSRAPLAVLTALVVAEAAVLLLRPRHGVIEPVPVRAQSYFSASQIERAQDFRDGQLLLFAAGLTVQIGILFALVRRPPLVLRRRWPRPYVAGAATGAALVVALTVAALPLDAVARRRAVDVGLVTQSWNGWAVDVVKSLGINAVLAATGAAVVLGLIARYPRRWWLPGAVAVVAMGAAFEFVGPVVLDPVFNSYTELPAGQTRSDVLAVARRAGVKVDHVYEVDASRRTTAVNAYVTGLGATKRVVLYDNLIHDFSRDETRVVVAHELGHVHYRDVPRGLLFLLVVAPFGMFAVQALSEALRGRGRGRGPFVYASIGPRTGPRVPAPRVLPVIALSLGLMSGAITVVSNSLSRRVEARADSFALQKTGASEAFISFERKVTVRNVVDPDPPGWVNVLLGTHPTTVQRIGAAKAYERSSGN